MHKTVNANEVQFFLLTSAPRHILLYLISSFSYLVFF